LPYFFSSPSDCWIRTFASPPRFVGNIIGDRRAAPVPFRRGPR
jgi:hypothetical protein